VPGREVLVEGRPADAHPPGDLVDAERADAVGGHQGECVIEGLVDDRGPATLDASDWA
jgi:hypothetical protein